jgi:hypothetical protein
VQTTIAFVVGAEHEGDTDVTVTAADADFVLSAKLVAVTVCEPALAGAVYKPVDDTDPAVEFPPFTPSTDQITEVFELFVTVAVNCCVASVAIFALVGLIVTAVWGVLPTVTVIVLVMRELLSVLRATKVQV